MSDLTKQFEGLDLKLDKTLEGIGEAKAKAATLETEIGSIKKSVTDVDAAVKEAQNIINTKTTDLTNQIKVVNDEVDKIKADSAKIIQQKTEAPKTFNQRLADAVNENIDNVQKFIKGETKKLSMELKAVGAVGTGNVTGTTNWGAGNDGKFIMNPNNIGHIRDFIPTRSYGPATDYYFMRENGAGEGSIAATAEGATKPQFDVDLVESSVKFEWIAGWMLMSRKAMLNIPGFLGFLQSRLPERLLDAEDQQILYGTGTSPEIKGILVSGNFVASTSTISNVLIRKIIDDMTLLTGTHKRRANGILLSPTQYYSLFLNVASGSGEFDLPPGVVIVNNQLSILGVPVGMTTALTGTDYVVGDFQNGTELLIQEAMNIQFFEQDSTNVRTNQVTVRIEEAVALPVYGSTFFVKGTSATA